MKIIIETEEEYNIVANMTYDLMDAEIDKLLKWFANAAERWEYLHDPWIWRYYEVEKGKSE